MEAPAFTVPGRILFGAAYYAEYHREERTEARSRPDEGRPGSR